MQAINRVDSVLNILTKSLGALAGIVFLLYAIGFLVVGSYYSSMQITPLEILETKYLSAGAYYIQQLAILFLPFAFLYAMNSMKLPPKPLILVRITRFGHKVIFLIFLGIVTFLVIKQALKEGPVPYTVSLQGGIFPVLFFLLFWYLAFSYAVIRQLRSILDQLLGVKFLLVPLIGFLFVSTLIFGVTFYGNGPRWRGGGAPFKVKIVLNEKARSLNLPLPVNSNLQTEQVNLIDISDFGYTIAFSAQSRNVIMELCRDYVSSIIYYEAITYDSAAHNQKTIDQE